MEGFFTKKETQSKSRPDGKVYSCASCGLYTEANSARMKIYGKGKKGILIIGEAPGVIEDRRGVPWQDKNGRLLQHTLAGLGIDIFEDCACINAVNCVPPDKRAPRQYEIDCCRIVMLDKAIEEFDPKVILLLGTSALQSIIGPRWKKDLGGIAKWRGWAIPDQDYKCWIVPTYHPHFVLKQLDQKAVTTIWKQDIEKALKLTNAPVHKERDPSIQYLTDISVFSNLKSGIGMFAFDYETTGIKPHAAGHRIVCTSITTSEVDTYVFMMPRTRKGLKPFLDLLTSPNIGKLAHNIKFEDTWTRNRLRVNIENWEWDSMLAAHLLDNRPGVTGLKFQTYVHFGVVDYASDVSEYLRSGEKNGNGMNKLPEACEDPDIAKRVMEYCALDSYYQFRLSQIQMKQLLYNDLPF